MNAFEDYSYGACRDYGHRWLHPTTYNTPGAPQSAGKRHLTRRRRCAECEAERRENFVVWTHRGTLERVSAYYAYPRDYRLKGHSAYDVASALRVQHLLAEAA